MKKIENYDFSNLKLISKVVYILSKVLEIILIVTNSILFVAGVACTFAVKHIKLSETSIYLGKIKLMSYDMEELMTSETGRKILETVKSFFESGTKPLVIPAYIFMCVIGLTILIFAFHYLYKLFKNIHESDTPFNNENISTITKLIYTLIIYICLPALISYIFEIIFKIPLLYSWGIFEVLIVLILFGVKYIFEYGVHLESK